MGEKGHVSWLINELQFYYTAFRNSAFFSEALEKIGLMHKVRIGEAVIEGLDMTPWGSGEMDKEGAEITLNLSLRQEQR